MVTKIVHPSLIKRPALCGLGVLFYDLLFYGLVTIQVKTEVAPHKDVGLGLRSAESEVDTNSNPRHPLLSSVSMATTVCVA